MIKILPHLFGHLKNEHDYQVAPQLCLAFFYCSGGNGRSPSKSYPRHILPPRHNHPPVSDEHLYRVNCIE
jgi:hypothetical protein